MVTAEQIQLMQVRLEKELASAGVDILDRFPMSDYLNDVKAGRRRWRLSNLGRIRMRKQTFESISSQYGDRALQLYLKLALCCFISDSLQRLDHERITEEIADLYHQWFAEVIDGLSTAPDDYYDYHSLPLAMDVRICSLTEIPVGGAWIVETRKAGLRPLTTGGIGQFMSYLTFALFKCGGFAPYYTTHTAPRHIKSFNEKEMNLTYLRMAELMKLNPKVKGFYRRSWFLDPKLEQISPRLTYLRRVPLQNGAKLFAAGSTQTDIKYALAVSPTRRRLHAEGKYMPTTYAFIWPRREFLDWADRMNADTIAAAEKT